MRLFLLKVLKKFQQFALGGFLRSLFLVLALFLTADLATAFSSASLSLSAVLSAAPFVHCWYSRFYITCRN
jgi:hypothetical protein